VHPSLVFAASVLLYGVVVAVLLGSPKGYRAPPALKVRWGQLQLLAAADRKAYVSVSICTPAVATYALTQPPLGSIPTTKRATTAALFLWP
jgi:hypothetical protein